MTQDKQKVAEELPESHKCPWLVQYLLASPIRRLIDPPGRLVGPFVRPGMIVAEPGCGFGYISLELARLVGEEGKVLSVDIEPRAVAKLRKRAAKAGLASRMEFFTCKSRDLGLAEYKGQIDLMAVINTLHEFDDLPGFLAQTAELLKPAGRMLVIEPKVHVTPENFQAELECCKQAGFRLLKMPDLDRRGRAALLELQ